MKELVIISGKGGTGKTSFSASLAQLAGKAVMADLDVDAPDLHLILQPEIKEEHPFESGGIAEIDPDKCVGCGICEEACAFDAITLDDDGIARLDPMGCEGCKLCVRLCPEEAIAFPSRLCGKWFLSDTRFGEMAHARLDPGQENSGRLVTLIKEEARKLAQANGAELILSDGTPGVGCPVIASLSGAAMVLVVTEPTPSGLSDLERALELCRHFKVPAKVAINKADLNTAMADEISDRAAKAGADVLARVDFFEGFVEAAANGRTIVEQAPGSPAAQGMRILWQALQRELADI